MKIMEKITAKAKNNWENEGVTIAFLGDSVTQGCFELYRKNNGDYETIFDKNNAYHAHLAKIFSVLYPSVPFNMINAGISGGSAPHGRDRLERDVIMHHPDLTVVCFGLNDAGGGPEKVSIYADALADIFRRLKEEEIEIIFMTPNMMATEISCHLPDEGQRNIAERITKVQLDGWLDLYIEEAKKVCAAYDVPVCDCYQKWKTLYENGVEITELLANKINHPTREMNMLFAASLVETMMEK